MDFNELKIDLRECNKWYQDRFPNKDLITINQLLGDYESLIDEVKELEERIRDLETDIDNNYRRVYHADPYEDRYI